ncbi:hypothetical protein GGS23DRAFT_421664 [Durotheca rogersii]|uniref:uncharacterized protein n=1 Tax=Durotheca rogersii TaxID=419775 RepID=UPI00221FDFFF|nr:uncharacterized protein GGS23DRAFT_421664 [Durotheca rogersii]KAI5865321.1 hypothetical protein GGS23DRAFT_421664 [Durotheca rogersii]
MKKILRRRDPFFFPFFSWRVHSWDDHDDDQNNNNNTKKNNGATTFGAASRPNEENGGWMCEERKKGGWHSAARHRKRVSEISRATITHSCPPFSLALSQSTASLPLSLRRLGRDHTYLRILANDRLGKSRHARPTHPHTRAFARRVPTIPRGAVSAGENCCVPALRQRTTLVRVVGEGGVGVRIRKGCVCIFSETRDGKRWEMRGVHSASAYQSGKR